MFSLPALRKASSWACVCSLIVLLCCASSVAGAENGRAARLVLSGSGSWSSAVNWSHEDKDSDGKPNKCAFQSASQTTLSQHIQFERREGSWEKVDEHHTVSVGGGGSAQCSGSGGFNGSFSVVAGPDNEDGYMRIRSSDFQEGYMVVEIREPASTTIDDDCVSCSFLGLFAAMECFLSISTNQNFKPTEVRLEFPTDGKAFQTSETISWSGEFGPCSGTFSATVNVSYTPGDWEAVIIPPHGLDEWLPTAGKDEWTPGNQLNVTIQLRAKGETEPTSEMKGIFSVYLEDVSRQPGICVNNPAKHRANTDYDLQLVETEEFGLWDDDRGQSMDSVSELSVTVDCYDYGAFGRLRVEVEADDGTRLQAYVEGDPGQNSLSFPLDENRNRIADFWEKQNKIPDGLPATWDEANEPSGQYTKGDGISLYEKYRGFIFNGVYERLDPNRKYVFVHDPEGLVHDSIQPGNKSSNFEEASGTFVRFVDAETWTGPGAAGSGKRVVNFNYTDETHATDQHALDIQFDFAANPAVPGEFNQMWRDRQGTDYVMDLRSTFGVAWPDLSWPTASPGGKLLITVYPFMHLRYVWEVVCYHTMGLPQFSTFGAMPAGPARDQMARDINQETDRFIGSSPGQQAERIWLETSTTIAHEMGHGIGISDLVPPSTGGPWECVMRYMGLADHPRNPNDRYELVARNPWPDVFCLDPTATTSGIACWKQIEVTDRRSGVARASFEAVERPSPRPIAPLHVASRPNSTIRPQNQVRLVETPSTLPILDLSAEILWDELYSGDPLRFRVRLTTPRARQSALLARLGQGVHQPAPRISTNWPGKLSMELHRSVSDGPSVLVMSGDDWAPFARPQLEPEALGWNVSVRSREWLVSPERAALQEGRYLLVLRWNGNGLLDPPVPDSYLFEWLQFDVKKPANDVDLARQSRRLAFHSFTVGNFEQARSQGLEALRLDPASQTAENWENRLLVINAGIQLGKYFQAAHDSIGLAPLKSVAEHSQSFTHFDMYKRLLLPSLRLKRAGPPGLEVSCLPGERYLVQSSTDLQRWADLETRTPSQSPFIVPIPSLGGNQYYRVLWLPSP
jgi:hypothetical protein